MAKKTIGALFVLIIGLMLVSCATPKLEKWKTAFTPKDLNSMVRSGQYDKKVDNFLVIFDASGSMAKPYKDTPKVNLAKDIIYRMNKTIPDMELMGGVRMFGRTTTVGKAETKLIWGMKRYNRNGMTGALDNIGFPMGESPLNHALNAAVADLGGVSGKKAIIIVSDGYETDMNYESAIKAAENIKNKMGYDVCLYTILVGNDAGGKELLDEIAKIGECGFSISADEIASSGDMAAFVENVFLTKVHKPAAPPPPPKKPAKVLDSDYDGVLDPQDRCPDTPLTAKVDKHGCWDIENVLFDFDKSVLKSKYYPTLDEVVNVMNKNPGLKMDIRGHTDSKGTENYNQGLSERRAKSVKDYLVKKGIARERLPKMGFGLTQPVASNLTEEGRTLNRRVELKPLR
jgi:OOP family OmpA-OmpF porin